MVVPFVTVLQVFFVTINFFLLFFKFPFLLCFIVLGDINGNLCSMKMGMLGSFLSLISYLIFFILFNCHSHG